MSPSLCKLSLIPAYVNKYNVEQDWISKFFNRIFRHRLLCLCHWLNSLCTAVDIGRQQLLSDNVWKPSGISTKKLWPGNDRVTIEPETQPCSLQKKKHSCEKNPNLIVVEIDFNFMVYLVWVRRPEHVVLTVYAAGLASVWWFRCGAHTPYECIVFHRLPSTAHCVIVLTDFRQVFQQLSAPLYHNIIGKCLELSSKKYIAKS